jgi:hypothetical protein
MSDQKFVTPTENIELPSKGLLYPKSNPLSSGFVEMKYMSAKEEDIITNVNLLKQGIAIERMLKSLIKSQIKYEDLLLGDRNMLLIAARILAYGPEYSFKYPHPITGEFEVVKVDLQQLNHKKVDYSVYNENNEFTFELPYTKNVVTFKILTVEDDNKIEQEIKSTKRVLGEDAIGEYTTRLKYQLTSINGDRSQATIRQYIDSGNLISRDSAPLRKYMRSVTPDLDMNINATFADGSTELVSLPIGADFFFPQD